MKLISTRDHKINANFETALFQGMPGTGGLYVPASIPELPVETVRSFSLMTFQDISFRIAYELLKDEIPADDLQGIIYQSMNFEVPLVEIDKGLYCLELFHGPSLAFKDFGARFMAYCMAHFARKSDRAVHILVATSGDTGSAVAQGFYNTPGVHVTILFPEGRVSPLQQKQLTTLGQNITALEIDGDFDDCQRLVKQAFTDASLKTKVPLSSANSINIARLIPQSFYYAEAFARLCESGKDIIFAVPCGNFGNLCGGLIAQKMGVPISRFIAATNANKIVPDFLETGIFQPTATQKTLSNAMDVGNPSNFERLEFLHDKDLNLMRSNLIGKSSDDIETRQAIQKMHKNFKYLVCPHTAISAKNAIQEKENYPSANYVFLGTAHPAKFTEIVEEAIGEKVLLPESLAALAKKPEFKISMRAEYAEFREYLTSKQA